MTDSEVIDFAEQHHEGINQSFVTRGRIKIPIARSSLVSVLYLGSGKTAAENNETALWFINKLANGEDLQDTDAVLHLRNRLSQQGSKELTNNMTRMLLTIAWNKTVLGEKCTPSGLRLRMTGPARQEPPNEIMVAES